MGGIKLKDASGKQRQLEKEAEKALRLNGVV
jgi:hypothetical protein